MCTWQLTHITSSLTKIALQCSLAHFYQHIEIYEYQRSRSRTCIPDEQEQHYMWTYSISKQTLLLTGLEKRQLKLLLHHVNAQASQFRLFVTHHICYIKSKTSNICAFCNKRFQEHQHISGQTIFVGSRSAIQISEFYKTRNTAQVQNLEAIWFVETRFNLILQGPEFVQRLFNPSKIGKLKRIYPLLC